jgi:hypothetical protein
MSELQVAQLITPRGETISLSFELYEAILKVLAERRSVRRMSKAELAALVEETQGKYAGGRSLVEALLVERAIERAREMKRVWERAEHSFKKR